ncbi:MAG: fibronectin type III domain-containing protein [Roseburia sp.]|nr:fibronectin type III domain-containing protein [Roseburia sp.]
MNRMKRSLWAWLLSVCMAVSAVPLPARAAQTNREARSVLAAEDMAASEASVSGNRIQRYSLVQEIPIDASHFPDENFRKYVEEKIDTDGDGQLSGEEQAKVWRISCSRMEISDLTGIEYFTKLSSLNCNNNNLSSLDVSVCPKLETLYCNNNNLSSLDVSGCTELSLLNCNNNNLSSLDVSGCPNLSHLYCENNHLSSLDLSGNGVLSTLSCNNTNLSSLDLSGCPKLGYLYCNENHLSDLDLSVCPNLRTLNCNENNLSSLDVSVCPDLETLSFHGNHLSSLDVSGNGALVYLYCNDNNLSSLDVSGCPALKTLWCNGNHLNSLDVSGNGALSILYCNGNHLSSLDVSGCPKLGTLDCKDNNLGSLDVSGCPALTNFNCENNHLSSLDVSGCPTLTSVSCSDNIYSMPRSSDNTYDLSKLPGNFDVSRAGNWKGGSIEGNILTAEAGVSRVTYTYDVDGSAGNKTGKFVLHMFLEEISIDESHFPDENFRKYVKETIDTDGDGKLSGEEQGGVISIDCSGKGISDLTGIEYFTNLKKLGCSDNKLSSLDVSGCPALLSVSCSDNIYSMLRSSDNTYDLSKLPGHFDVSRASDWQGGSVEGHILTVEAGVSRVTYTYDVDGSAGNKTGKFVLHMFLEEISIDESHFPDENFRKYVKETIDTDGDGKLSGEEQGGVISIDCSGKGISDLTGIEYFTKLAELGCSDNNLSSLDVSGCPALETLSCSDNIYSMPRSLDNTYDLSKLPGNFDVSRASDWQGGSVEGNILTVDAEVEQVTYTYDVDGSNGDKTEEFTLKITDNQDPAPHTHTYDVGRVTKAATCKEAGVKTYTCTVCGETKTEEIAKLTTHTYDAGKITKAATCKAAGVKTYTCTVCGGTKTEAIPKLTAHTYDAGKITKAATCKAAGVKTYTCTVCGGTKTEAIPKLTAHTYDAGKITKAATCKAAGVKTYTCTVCGGTKTEAIPKLTTHTYDAGKITKAATCKAEGVKTYTCTVCKVTKTEKIPKADHTYKTTVVKATRKKDGKSTTACTVCGKVKSTKVISRPASITLKKTSYTYNGKAKKPGVVVKDAAGETIGSSNYTVTYEKGRKKIGKYKVTVTFKGNYSGKKSLSFTIKPPAPKLRSVAAGSKKLTVKWKKQSRATGYEIQYSTNKNFTKSTVKKVTVKKKSTVKKTITGLKAKKTYYVRIRAYKTVSGKKYYSAWSSPKKVVTKK